VRPTESGLGILAARDKKLMMQICEAQIVLEICPTSNLLTKALASEDPLRETSRAFADNVQFTIARDGPEMMRTHLRDEFELLLRIGALEESQLSEANRQEHEASFMPSRIAQTA
jgi:adenosine deaminase